MYFLSIRLLKMNEAFIISLICSLQSVRVKFSPLIDNEGGV